MYSILPRLLLSCSILMPPLASATGRSRVHHPVFQRRAMAKAIAPFVSSLKPAERRKLFETNLAAGRIKTDSEKQAALDEVAIELAEITGQYVRHARAGDIDAARESLRAFMINTLRAASLNLVYSETERGAAGLVTLATAFIVSFGTLLPAAFAQAYFDSQLLVPLVKVLAVSTAGIFSGFGILLPLDYRIPGSAKFAHAIGYSKPFDHFWARVGSYLKTDPLLAHFNLKTGWHFAALLESELNEINLDQACVNALRLAPGEWKASLPSI